MYRGEFMKNTVLIDKFCKWLAIGVLIGLFLTIVLQGLLQIDGLRSILVPVEQWEGERLPFA